MIEILDFIVSMESESFGTFAILLLLVFVVPIFLYTLTLTEEE